MIMLTTLEYVRFTTTAVWYNTPFERRPNANKFVAENLEFQPSILNTISFFYKRILIMRDISKIDPNLKVESSIDESDIRFYDIKCTPFKIYGVFYENGKFRRIPEDVAKCVSNGVYALHANTAGGRV